ncbi:MAG: T9SS type A sorting domain-containing protein, partial [Bacteroidota bacterium]
TGLEENEILSASTKVSPNPFQTGFQLEIGLESAQNLRAEIVDVNGKRLFVKDFGKLLAGQNQLELEGPEVAALASGVYFLNLFTDEAKATEKLMKF